ncbi:SDR family NAD(P)-dependent oxidoreductase [Streptomyces gobiensis]|uniref:SDR family NAD(P)-dependent oxidoreductase n=1 Tax=Streptomyces gobiensis TaxID=2875706 RepID=UPI001E65C954|nr:SDR family NAD(P)-dependent oxidoreductase [Streptomyces gobiensis]UGY94909.1 SDR family oxidoreductase [Streptomyces gobiensis]
MRLSGLDGWVIVVTGAGGGIGAAVCRTLASCGARIAAVDRDKEALRRLLDKDGTDDGPQLMGCPADVTLASAAEQVLDRVHAELGPVNALVNAAGVLRTGPAVCCPEDDWSELLAVNATGVFLWSRAAARRMAERRAGAIVTVASNSVGVPRTGMAAYAASKAAASAFTLALGLELAELGIRCNVVCPGSTDTPMLSAMGPDAAAAAIRGNPASHRTGIPLRRVADPQDIADAVAFLLSDQARHITLHSLYVDGGAALHG